VCRNGHPWVEENLYTNSRGYNGCKACQKEWARQRQQGPLKSHLNEVSRQWRKANPDYMRSYNLQYRKDNAERLAAQKADYYQANREALDARAAAWRAAHPDETKAMARQSEQRRRAKQRENGVYEISPKDMDRLVRQPCAHAHRGGCDGRMEIDHILPISRGGSHGIGNLQMLCRRHNASKSNSLEVEVKSRAQEDAAA
jgi:5-methylcytosine-specific restriction endonuclease McrA